MKMGRYAAAKVNSEKVMGMCDGLKATFGEDYAIVASKFFMQQANLAFVYGKLEEAKAAAESGLELVVTVSTEDEDIKKASNHTQRDLLNMLVRVRAKLEGVEARQLRAEVAEKRGIALTFMAGQDQEMKKLEEVH